MSGGVGRATSAEEVAMADVDETQPASRPWLGDYLDEAVARHMCVTICQVDHPMRLVPSESFSGPTFPMAQQFAEKFHAHPPSVALS